MHLTHHNILHLLHHVAHLLVEHRNFSLHAHPFSEFEEVFEEKVWNIIMQLPSKMVQPRPYST